MGDRHLATPPDSSESEPSFSMNDPRPHFYIVRPDKTFVPLIAIDEINPMFRIHGVPVSLTADDIEEWRMARCGDQIDRPKNYYRMDFSTNGDAKSRLVHSLHHDLSISKAEEKATQQPDQATDGLDKLRNSLLPSKDDCIIPKLNGSGIQGQQGSSGIGAAEDQANETEVHNETQSAEEQVVKNSKWAREEHQSKTKNAATPGIYGKKKFCTYWIRTGNCDYIQEGCKYLHVIPDEETRLRIGIRDMPRWAKEDIPTPQNDFFAKQSPSTNQDWRRKATPAGHVNELPQELRTQCRATLPPPLPDQYNRIGYVQPNHLPPVSVKQANAEQDNQATSIYASQMEHAKGIQNARSAFPTPQMAQPMHGRNGQQVPPFFDFPAQAFPNHTKPKPQHNKSKSGFSLAPPKVAASSVAESFERQMLVNAPLTSPILATPTSASTRYSPPTQPPISRPLNAPYYTPDRVSEGDQTLKHAEGDVRVIGGTQPTGQQNRANHLPSPINEQIQSASLLRSRGRVIPLPSHLTRIPTNSRPNSPAGASIKSFAQTPMKTSAPQGSSKAVSQSASVSLNEIFGHGKQPELDGNGLNSSSTHLLRTFEGKQNDSPTSLANNSGKHKTISLPNNNTNGTATGPNGHSASTSKKSPPPSKTNGSGAKDRLSSANPRVIMHRRHFVGPGEPQYISASLSAERALASTSKPVDGEQKKRARGRDNEAYSLINTET